MRMYGSVWNSCNHEPKIIFSYDGVEYYACDAAGADRFTGDFVINFTKTRNTPEGNSFKQLREYFNFAYEELQVPWPDFETPRIKNEFWEALHKYVKRRKWTSVCFHCQGGHGRTGTALAAMLIVNAGYTPDEAVEWVRETHCKEAVESSAQCEYLLELDKQFNNREDCKDISPAVNLVEQEGLPDYYSQFQNFESYEEWIEASIKEREKEKEAEMNYKYIDDD